MAGNLAPLLNQIHRLPDLLEECLPTFTDAVRTALPTGPCSSVRRFRVTGCGDSHQAALGSEMETTIGSNETAIKHLVESWGEGSGDPAAGQDIEEWTHLQYFACERATPTCIIDASRRSTRRAPKAAVAVKAIGRRVAAVVPREEFAITTQAGAVSTLQARVRETFSPILFRLAGILFAAYRAQLKVVEVSAESSRVRSRTIASCDRRAI